MVAFLLSVWFTFWVFFVCLLVLYFCFHCLLCKDGEEPVNERNSGCIQIFQHCPHILATQ